MSNVVPLFGKEAPAAGDGLVDLIEAIVNWAGDAGIDIHDTAFKIRTTDFMTYLQVMLNDAKV